MSHMQSALAEEDKERERAEEKGRPSSSKGNWDGVKMKKYGKIFLTLTTQLTRSCNLNLMHPVQFIICHMVINC